MLTERQKHILALAIKEYVDTAVPVSSKVLVKKYGLKESPATLRSELARLCDEAYLVQPHTSAGRIPTEKGYRFYIKYLMEPSPVTEGDRKEIRKHLSTKAVSPGKTIARTIANSSGSLGIYFDSREGTLYKEGLPEVFRNPDFQALEQLFEFMEFLEELERSVSRLLHYFWGAERPMILVGRQRFLALPEDYSILYSGFRRRERDYVIGLMGPSRMNYARNVSLLDFIRHELTENDDSF